MSKFSVEQLARLKRIIGITPVPIPPEVIKPKRQVNIDARLRILVDEYAQGNPIARLILDNLSKLSDAEILIVQDHLISAIGFGPVTYTPRPQNDTPAPDHFGAYDICQPFANVKAIGMYTYDDNGNAILPDGRVHKRL